MRLGACSSRHKARSEDTDYRRYTTSLAMQGMYESRSHDARALVDLAINDHEIIKSNADNEVWIKGRHKTFFRNAFLIKSPILPSKILSIQKIKEDFMYPNEFIKFEDLLG